MEMLSKEFNIRQDKHQELVDQLHKVWRDGKKIPFGVDWFPLMWDYKVGISEGIISQKFIEKEMRNPEIDFQQEYCCKFTSTYTSAIPVESLTFLDSREKGYVEPIDLNEMTEDMVEPDYEKDYDKDADVTMA